MTNFTKGNMIKIFLLLTVIFFSCNNVQIKDYLVDSDGDGISDLQEKEFFNPNVDNRKFNPLISDLPILKIEIQDIPSIEINYIRESSSSYSYSTGYSREEENITGTDSSWTGGIKISAGYDGGFVAKGEISASKTVTDIESERITTSIQRSIERASYYNLTATEAKISVPVFISNIGNMPSKLTDLILTAYTINNSGKIEMIGSLRADGGFEEIYLLPNSEPVVINFINTDLYPHTISNILLRAKQIIIVPSSYNLDLLLSDITLNYHEAYSKVQINTVRINIKNFDQISAYNVAIQNGSSLNDLFNILKLDYIKKDGWFSYINKERGHNEFTNGEWVLEHSGKRNGINFINKYSSFNKIEFDIPFLEKSDVIILYKEKIVKKYNPGDELYRWSKTQNVIPAGATWRYKYIHELINNPSILMLANDWGTLKISESSDSLNYRIDREISHFAEVENPFIIDRYIISAKHEMIRNSNERLQQLYTNIDLAIEPTRKFSFVFGNSTSTIKTIFVNGINMSEYIDLKSKTIHIDLDQFEIKDDFIYSIEFVFYDIVDPKVILYYPMIANNKKWENFNQYQIYNFIKP